MKGLLILVLVLVGIGAGAFAQEKSSREQKGDKFYFTYTYDKAIDRYSRAKNLTVEGQRKLAECYWITGQNSEAEERYATLINQEAELIAEDYFNYGMVLKCSGKYNESEVQMEKFCTKKPNDLRAISYKKNKDLLPTLVKDNGNYAIHEMDINTGYQDFGTSYFKEQIVYTSSNSKPKAFQRKYNWNNEPFLNLYVADVEDGQLTNPTFFDKKENGKMHDGPATFNQLGTFMAFTKNARKDKSEDNIVELQIHTRSFENGTWSEPKAFPYNSPSYNVGHPNLSDDGTIMYFVSDMPGGFGGTDLYRTTRTPEGAWSAPMNLGNAINTESDELFPFFDEENPTLHFTSNGHYGLGGYDIFSSAKNGDSWGDVSNAGAPLNTRFDDFALVISGAENKGYFSSNRENGSGNDDIYGVDLLNTPAVVKQINGVALDVNQVPLPRTTVKLYNEAGKQINMAIAEKDGSYSFNVEANKNYELTGNLKDYIEGKNVGNTYGDDNIVTINLVLLQLEEEEVVVLEEHIVVDQDLGAIMKLKPIYFEFDKSAITPTAAKELDKMIKVLNQYPNMEISVTSHTDCRGAKSYNETLSQARATASADYIKARITNPQRITGKGFGEVQLANGCACEGETESGCSEAEHRLNRRSEFIVTKNNSPAGVVER